MLFDSCKNTKEQGNIGFGKAISYFTQNGYTVSIPLNDSQDYDLIVDKDNNLYRVQVKTTKSLSKNKENYSVNLRICGGNSKQNYVHKNGTEVIYDLLFVLCDNGMMFLIPKEQISSHKTSVFVGKNLKEGSVMIFC